MTLDVIQWYLENIRDQFHKGGLLITKVSFSYEPHITAPDGELAPWAVEAEYVHDDTTITFTNRRASIERCVQSTQEFIQEAHLYLAEYVEESGVVYD